MKIERFSTKLMETVRNGVAKRDGKNGASGRRRVDCQGNLGSLTCPVRATGDLAFLMGTKNMSLAVQDIYNKYRP